ncbi:MAG TPA: response regulator [Pyrinomonadaceae bacterium]|jgi:DNA-binding response OmpR family regulator
MPQTKCRILCVDDHEDTSLMLTHLLGQSNYEVVTAESIANALRLAQTEEFDLYVLDKRMPDGTGLDLCRLLNSATPQIPIIFYSGDAYAMHRHEGLCAGAEAYITKPNIDELVQTVNHILNARECASVTA